MLRARTWACVTAGFRRAGVAATAGAPSAPLGLWSEMPVAVTGGARVGEAGRVGNVRAISSGQEGANATLVRTKPFSYEVDLTSAIMQCHVSFPART